jgi:hypothetical protein
MPLVNCGVPTLATTNLHVYQVRAQLHLVC